MINTHKMEHRSNRKPVVDVCFSPSMFDLYDPKDSIVVVIDVLRATSSICTAFHYGARSIIPVSTVEVALEYKKKGYLAGAERHGEKVEGFDFGNSPFSYMTPEIRGKDIVLTTTNGTRAIHTAKDARIVTVGSFLNLDVLAAWLKEQKRDVIALCAGWKSSFNLEDTLFAGALVYKLRSEFDFSLGRDSCMAAEYLYLLAKNDLFKFLNESSHRIRLKKLGIEKDIEYCLTLNGTGVIPVLRDGILYDSFQLQPSGAGF